MGQLLRFAAPNVIMMVFMSLYTIVDGMFIAQYLGSLALSGLNMVMPAFSLMVAISLMLSIGGSAVCARLIGEGKQKQAEQTFSMLVYLLIGISVIGAALSISYLDEIIRLLGSTDKQHAYSYDYGFYCALFAPAFFLQVCFQTFFVAAGRPSLGLLFTGIGGVMNIVLDYIMLDLLGMGIAGAAVATGIGAAVPALGGLIYFSCRQGSNLRLTQARFQWQELVAISSNGASEMVTHLSSGVTTFLFNLVCLRYYGENGVAAISIILYLQFLFSAFFFGYAEGVAPITSYHWGAKTAGRLRALYRNNIRVIAMLSLLVLLISLMGIEGILGLFSKGEENGDALSIAQSGFYLYVWGYLFLGFNVFASAHFTALGNGILSGLLSFVRTFCCLAPSIYVLPMLIGDKGIWLAVPLAELIGLIVSFYFLRRYRARYQY